MYRTVHSVSLPDISGIFVKLCEKCVSDYFQYHCHTNSASDLVVQLTGDKTHVKADVKGR